MIGQNIRIYIVQITRKWICETFPPLWHDLIISLPWRTPPPPPYKFAQKRFYPMKYFLKNVPRPYFSGGDINEY